MRTVLLVAALVVLVLVSASAQAIDSWADGNELKKMCHSEANFDQGVCGGFAIAVAGIVDNYPVAGYRTCIPSGVLAGQLNNIMVKFLDDHPERLHYAATSLAVEAFVEAFPCPK